MTDVRKSVEVYIIPEMYDDLHRLYCRKNWISILVWSGFGLFMATIPITAHRDDGKPADPYFSIALIILGVALILRGLALSSAWWRWHYWPLVQKELPKSHSIHLLYDDLGIFFDGVGGRTPFSMYYSIKLDNKAVLLFVTPSYAFPLHRSLFQSDEDWQYFLESVKSQMRFQQRMQAP